jgi:hypothetical protein
LPRDTTLALYIPTVLEQRIVVRNEFGRRLVRRMARPQGEPQEPRGGWTFGVVVG